MKSAIETMFCVFDSRVMCAISGEASPIIATGPI